MSGAGETHGLADGTRLVVLRGDATPEETAALLAAVDAAERRARAARQRPQLPAWQRAAYLEAVGGRAVAAPAHLEPRLDHP